MTGAAKSRERLVVFAGAGVSSYAGIPMMSQFADALRLGNLLSQEESDRFDMIQSTCDRLSAVIGQSARNLEQLASFLDVLQMLRPDVRFGSLDVEQARNFVIDCMRRVVKPGLSTRDLDQGFRSAQLILGLYGQFDLTVVTTNYDIGFEIAAVADKIRLFPGGDIAIACENIDRGDSCYAAAPGHDERCVRLFKLHGSANWFTANSGALFLVEDRMFPDAQGGPNDTSVQIGQASINHRPVASAVPMMVPPSVLKPHVPGELLHQWRGAIDAMRAADRIWFIGYSFPESDAFMRFMLASGLFDNPRLRQIVVIDPDYSVLRRVGATVFRSPAHRQILHRFALPMHRIDFKLLAAGQLYEQWQRLRNDMEMRQSYDEWLADLDAPT